MLNRGTHDLGLKKSASLWLLSNRYNLVPFGIFTQLADRQFALLSDNEHINITQSQDPWQSLVDV